MLGELKIFKLAVLKKDFFVVKFYGNLLVENILWKNGTSQILIDR